MSGGAAHLAAHTSARKFGEWGGGCRLTENLSTAAEMGIAHLRVRPLQPPFWRIEMSSCHALVCMGLQISEGHHCELSKFEYDARISVCNDIFVQPRTRG